jgi:DNA-binding NtrC family response regulator
VPGELRRRPGVGDATERDTAPQPLDGRERWFLAVRGVEPPRIIDLPDGSELTIGRAPEADLFIDDGRVSRQHAVLSRHGFEVTITDLGSSNGVVINGRALRGGRAALRRGDVVGVGPADLAVAVSSGGTAGARPAAVEPVVVEPAMVRVYEVARRLAQAPTTVLVLGETGVGKELVAEAIHHGGKRAGQPFVRLSCGALPEALLESELFGHEKGAFTGADRRRIGYFEAAAGGTIFLDEIGELTAATQVKLLRTLERKIIQRLGSSEEIAVDARVVCATHRDLAQRVAEGHFRQDLFYRISTFKLEVPPLRERAREVPVLCEHFARRFAEELGVTPPSFDAASMALLEHHAWPGNVRELKGAIEHAVILQTDGVVRPEHLPEAVRAPMDAAAAAPAGAETMKGTLEALERAAIERALTATGQNQTQAALLLKMSRRALIYKMGKYGLGRG